MEQAFYTVNELAATYGVKPGAIRNFLKKHWLTFYKVGTMVRIHRDDWNAFIKKNPSINEKT
jgi:excisionase family DNA binding protein